MKKYLIAYMRVDREPDEKGIRATGYFNECIEGSVVQWLMEKFDNPDRKYDYVVLMSVEIGDLEWKYFRQKVLQGIQENMSHAFSEAQNLKEEGLNEGSSDQQS